MSGTGEPHRRTAGGRAEGYASARDDAPAPPGLEALGLLAAGIAHDINNILAAVRGNVELAREALATPVPDLATAAADLDEVERAVGRASALVRQLLAFGRRQAHAPEPLDLSAVVRAAAALLHTLVGDEIRIALRLASDLPPAHADRSQVEQVLVNLVLNGRDAITDALHAPGAGAGAGSNGSPGVLTVTTTVERVTVDDAASLDLPAPGTYVVLAVHDDGIGMDEATRARIFAPFFTTKPPDRGTGLGLAATWGIVRQTGGAIRVETAPGRGSTFAVYLPAERAPAGAPHERGGGRAGTRAREGVPAATWPAVPASTPEPSVGDALPVPTGGTGGEDFASAGTAGRWTILFAEDDHAVRRATSRILRNAGHRVLEAGDGRAGLALWRAHAAEVDLLIADVRMPYLRGDALGAAVRAEGGRCPVVLITGFAEEPAAPDAGAPRAAGDPAGPPLVLAKPFSAADLLGCVAAAMRAAEARSPNASA